MADPPALQETGRLLQRVLRGMQQRALLGPKDGARGPLEANLLAGLAALSSEMDGTPQAPLDAVPPRRVAVAMALALHSQPHLGATFGPPARGGTFPLEERGPYPAEAPLVVPSEVLEVALGLSQWELDDLREEVDRRAGLALKQERALGWVWSHFGLPKARGGPLFRVLYPAEDRRAGGADVLCRGGRLYAVVDAPNVSPAQLYLGWRSRETEGAVGPLSFRARYVDHGLRRSLARGIGAEPPEVDDILERMVAILPRDQVQRLLERDQWRSTGMSSLCTLGDDYLGNAGLIGPVEHGALDWTRWLVVKDGAVVVDRSARSLFDEFALSRAQKMMLSVYAGLLARLDQLDSDRHPFEAEDLDLMDVGGHLRAVLSPLVAWARSETTHATVAARLRVDRSAAKAALDALGDAWEEHLEARWLAPPTEDRRHTIAAIALGHLVATRNSILRLLHRAPDARWEHRSMVLLFVGHFVADAPIERLWLKGLSDMPGDESAALPPPEDVVGCWFWSAWQRVLGSMEVESASDTITP